MTEAIILSSGSSSLFKVHQVNKFVLQLVMTQSRTKSEHTCHRRKHNRTSNLVEGRCSVRHQTKHKHTSSLHSELKDCNSTGMAGSSINTAADVQSTTTAL